MTKAMKKSAQSIRRNQDGLTLIELIISISISALIFILLTQVYILAQNTYAETDAKAEITQNGRVILDRMVREIRQSPYIDNQLPSGAVEPIPSQIIFQDGHDTSRISYIRYYLEGDKIYRRVIAYSFPSQRDYYVHSYDIDKNEPHNPPDSFILDTRIVGEYVSDIEFYGDPLININLYLMRNNQTATISTAVYGRNF